MRQAVARLILLGSAALLLMSACGGGGSEGGNNGGGNPQPANVAPTANAGAPQTVNAGATVTLNGAASSDSDGSIATYAWTQTAGPVVTLNNLATAQPSFVAPQGGAVANLTFRLVVTDNRGASSAASTVTITINPLLNAAPTANAGSPQTVTANTPVTLNGTASNDPDGSIAAYAWTQTAGTGVTLLNAGTSQPSFVAPPGAATATLTFSLVVTDNLGGTSLAATVTITVITPPANVAPTASAGMPQTVTAGATVTLNGTASSDSDGVITGYVWTQISGATVTLLNASSAQPGFVAPQVTSTSILTFRLVVIDDDGAASAPSTVAITVSPPLTGNGTFSGVIRYTRIGLLNFSPFGLDFGSVLQRPARGVIVRALDASTQAVLATSITDASGGYTFTVASNINVNIQVVARLQRDNTQPLPRWDVRVQDGVPGTNPYTYTSEAFNSNVTTQDIVIPSGLNSSGVATGVRASGPFAILDTIYTAIQAVTAPGIAPTANFPALIVDWGSQTVGTFFSTNGGQHIALMGDLSEDTDEFDQHVVAHEFGHYIERNFGRSDSIGGPHAIGDQLDPRVAFGEGFGYAFAAIVLNDPIVRDTFFDQNGQPRGGGFNVEVNPPNLSIAGPGCWCSETTVWSILWDLYDGDSDGSDGITMGLAPIWEALTSTSIPSAHRTTPAVTSIFSFVTALKAARPGQAGQIDTLVSAQNIVASTINPFATTETNNPLSPPNNALPVFTDISVGTPVVVRTTGTADRHYNNLGNRRYLRFTPAASGTVTLTLTTTNTAPTRDPDFLVFSSGGLVRQGTNSSAEYPETETFSVTGGTTYIIDAYDCANGCSDVEGTPGDYDLTVTIN
jgi:hypothetical protein